MVFALPAFFAVNNPAQIRPISRSLHHPFTPRVHPAPMEKSYLQDDLMKPSTKNLVRAIGLAALGVALAAGGI